MPCCIFSNLTEVVLIVLRTSGGLFVEREILYNGHPVEPHVWPEVVLAQDRVTVGKTVGDRVLLGERRSNSRGAVGTHIQNLNIN